MPVGTGGKWYDDPEAAVAADLPITVLSAADTTTYAFDAEDYDAVLAILNTHELYSSAMAGADNDIVVVAQASGTSALTIALVDPSAEDASLSVSKSTNAISVSLATDDEGEVTSTASEVVAALNSDSDSAPFVKAFLAASNDGTGVVVPFAAQGLADWSGTSPSVTVSLETSTDGTNWYAVGTAFGAKTGAGADEGRAYGPLAPSCRWKAVMTGSGGLGAAISIDASGKK